MLSFITPAHAASAASPSGLDIMGFLPFVLVIGIMYFFLIRPQQKKAKEHQEVLKKIVKGDQVITSGGIFATVTKIIDDARVEVDLGTAIHVVLLRSSISQVLPDEKALKVASSKAEKPAAATPLVAPKAPAKNPRKPVAAKK